MASDEIETEFVVRATFDEDGFPTALYPSNDWPEGYPDSAVVITVYEWRDILENPGLRKLVDGKLVEFSPPSGESVTIIPAVTLWERMSDAEAEMVNSDMATRPFRTRQIFLTANTFRSDHELWPLLVQMATDLFGEARAAELLAACY